MLSAPRASFLPGYGSGHQALLEGLCPRVTPLFEQSYSEERPRLNAYEHMAISVIRAALENPP